MGRSWRTRLVGLAIVAVVAGGVGWWVNRGTPIPDHPPASAPKVGSCWTVSPQTAQRALPWPGGDGFVTRTGSLAGQGKALAVGCVERDARTIRFASCDGTHTGEFVGTYIVTPSGAPFDQKAVDAAVTKGCGQVTLSYLGLPADATRPDLHIGYVGPTTQATWLGSDQTFACYASADAQLRGTVRGLGTRPLPQVPQ